MHFRGRLGVMGEMWGLLGKESKDEAPSWGPLKSGKRSLDTGDWGG